MEVKRGLVLVLLIVTVSVIVLNIIAFILNLNTVIGRLSFTRLFWLYAFPGLLTMVVYIGMFWIMRAFKEAKWLQSALIIFFICRVAVIIFPILQITHVGTNGMWLTSMLVNISLFYMTLAFALVQHVTIRWYYRVFAFLLLLGQFSVNAVDMVNQFFSYSWIKSGFQLVFTLPFIVSLLLFIKLYQTSKEKQQEYSVPVDL